MTFELLIEMAIGLKDNDFSGFARKVSAVDPVLGATVALHADAADGNSPDLAGWIEGTMDDAASLANGGITTAAAAEAWWLEKYECD
jgi:hypothetical protein